MSRPGGIPLITVDAFADRMFRGNPAAVCVTDEPLADPLMKLIAMEMNLSETAFVTPIDGGFSLRWFTPAVEVDLCGHATLASAHVLWQSGRLGSGEEARFHTRSGWLTANRIEDWIELDFPGKRPEPSEAPPDLLEALDVQPLWIGRSKFDYLLELKSEDIVRAVQPDFARLAKVPIRGVIVTSRGREYDMVSRFFAPASGVNEDPVTGSAHTALTPYWGEKFNKTELTAFQASPRGGVLRLRWCGDRVKLGGQAITVLTGELRV